MEYFVPSGFGEAEFIEKRSRFIGRVWRTDTEEEALARIAEMREKHWDATHNVYAYIIKDGGAMRYSDDGEPQGTSGMPVLGVFRSAGVFNVCCVVTRYFGGVLLGAGGLVRAYSHTAALALESAGISVMRRWKELKMNCPYSYFERVKLEIAAYDGAIENIDYGSEVVIEALLPASKAGDFNARLIDMTAGTLAAEITGECYRAVDLKGRNDE
ncbi:MAG: DUF1949 domain-containing protein [Clostridiales bacterium]|nr:DUF1949 domain-containing protein [Clostridiales bacterium]